MRVAVLVVAAVLVAYVTAISQAKQRRYLNSVKRKQEHLQRTEKNAKAKHNADAETMRRAHQDHQSHLSKRPAYVRAKTGASLGPLLPGAPYPIANPDFVGYNPEVVHQGQLRYGQKKIVIQGRRGEADQHIHSVTVDSARRQHHNFDQSEQYLLGRATRAQKNHGRSVEKYGNAVANRGIKTPRLRMEQQRIEESLKSSEESSKRRKERRNRAGAEDNLDLSGLFDT
jgi:hypothetical protein